MNRVLILVPLYLLRKICSCKISIPIYKHWGTYFLCKHLWIISFISLIRCLLFVCSFNSFKLLHFYYFSLTEPPSYYGKNEFPQIRPGPFFWVRLEWSQDTLCSIWRVLVAFLFKTVKYFLNSFFSVFLEYWINFVNFLFTWDTYCTFLNILYIMYSMNIWLFVIPLSWKFSLAMLILCGSIIIFFLS